MTQYQPHTPNRIHSRGFTLVELMVTIAVMGIIAAFAAPSFSRQLASKRIESTTQAIPNAIQYAKSQALINRQVLDIEIGTQAVKVKNGSDILETYAIDSKTTITAKNSAPTTLRVFPKGNITKADTHNTAIPSNAYFEICDNQISGETGRKVIVSAVGQVQIASSGVTCS